MFVETCVFIVYYQDQLEYTAPEVGVAMVYFDIKTLMISDPRIEGCVVLILMRCRVFQLTLLPFTTVLSCCLCRYKKILDLSFIGSCQILCWFACVYVWCILLCVNDSFINVEVYCTCEYKIIKDIIKYLLVDCKK